jgi:predicted RNase H-like nuclease (RuvC/YqgF family)
LKLIGSEKELAEAYKWTNTRIEELRLVIERQEETNKELVRDKEEILSIVSTLEEKVTLFNSKLTNMKKL